MIREGPGGRVAVQLPSGPVVTAAAWVNAFEPLSGAVKTATGWPASGRPRAAHQQPLHSHRPAKRDACRVASLAVDRAAAPSQLTVPSHGCPCDRCSRPGMGQRSHAAPRGRPRRGSPAAAMGTATTAGAKSSRLLRQSETARPACPGPPGTRSPAGAGLVLPLLRQLRVRGLRWRIAWSESCSRLTSETA